MADPDPYEYAQPLGALFLTPKLRKLLHREGIKTVEILLATSEAELLDIPRLGTGSIHELRQKLKAARLGPLETGYMQPPRQRPGDRG